MTVTPNVSEVPVSSIRENPVALRAVNRDDESYIGLRDSISQVGLLNPVSVRRQVDDSGDYFELVDGLHRYSAVCDIGLKDIKINVVDLDESQTLEAQVMANVHKIETKPVQYTKQLQRMFAANPTLTLGGMAAKLAKSTSWVGQRLNLLKLEKAIQDLVDNGQINVSNAVILSKLPSDEQGNFVEQAVSLNADEFTPLISSRMQEITKARREGRSKSPQEFIPNPQLQKMSALKEEFIGAKIGPELCASNNLGAKSVTGFALAIAWVLNMDPNSVTIRKAADDARKQAVVEAANKRKSERAKKKADEAARLAAEAAEKIK